MFRSYSNNEIGYLRKKNTKIEYPAISKKKKVIPAMIISSLLIFTAVFYLNDYISSLSDSKYYSDTATINTTKIHEIETPNAAWGGSNITINITLETYDEFQGYINVEFRELNDNGDDTSNETYSKTSKYISYIGEGNHNESISIPIPEHDEYDSDYNSTSKGAQYFIRAWISEVPLGEAYSNTKENPIELYWGPKIESYPKAVMTDTTGYVNLSWENMHENPNVPALGFFMILELYNYTNNQKIFFKEYESSHLNSTNGTYNFSIDFSGMYGVFYWQAFSCGAYWKYTGTEWIIAAETSAIIANDSSESFSVLEQGLNVLYTRDIVYGGQNHETWFGWALDNKNYTLTVEFRQNATDTGVQTHTVYSNKTINITGVGVESFYLWIPNPNTYPDYTMNASYEYYAYIKNETELIEYEKNKTVLLRWAPKITEYDQKIIAGFDTNISVAYYDLPADRSWYLTLRFLRYNGSRYEFDNTSISETISVSGSGTHTFTVKAPAIVNHSQEYVWSATVHPNFELDEGYLGSDITEFLTIEKPVTIESYPTLMYPNNQYVVNVSWNITDSALLPINLTLMLAYMDGNWWDTLPWLDYTITTGNEVGYHEFEIDLASNYETSQTYLWVAWLWYENSTNSKGIDQKFTNIAGLGLPHYPSVVYKGTTYMVNVSYDLNESKIVEYGIKNSDNEIIWQKLIIPYNLTELEEVPLYIPTPSDEFLDENATIYVRADGYNEVDINITAYDAPKIFSAPDEISESATYEINVTWSHLGNGTYNLSLALMQSGTHYYLPGMPWLNYTFTVVNDDNATSSHNFSVEIPSVMSASTLYEWSAWICVGAVDDYDYLVGSDVLDKVRLDKNITILYAPDEVYRGNKYAIEVSYYVHPTPLSGVTEIEIENKRIYIDDIEYQIRSIAYSPYQNGSDPSADPNYYPDEALVDADFAKIKEMGANAIRTYDLRRPYILDLAQKHGLFVIVDKYIEPSINFADDTCYQNNLTQYMREIAELIDNYSTHPAVLMWVIGNEVIANANNKPRAYDFIAELVNFTQRYDNKKHPVTYTPRTDILNVPATYNFSFLDVISTNFYSALSSPPSQDPLDTSQLNGILDDITTWYPNLPSFVSETGWYTNGSPNFVERNQSDYINAHWDLINNKDQVIGVNFFEYSDEWWKAGNSNQQDSHCEEHWGIVYENRTLKLAYYTLRDLWHFEIEYGTENATHNLTKEYINTTKAQKLKLYPWVLDPQSGWDQSTQLGYWYIVDPISGTKLKQSFLAYNTPKIEDAPAEITYGQQYDVNVSWEHLPIGTFNITVALMVNGTHVYPEGYDMPWQDELLYNLDGSNASGSRNITITTPLMIDPTVYYEWVAWISNGPSDNESYRLGSDIEGNVVAIAPSLELINPPKSVTVYDIYELNVSWKNVMPGHYNLSIALLMNGTNATNHYWWPGLPWFNTTFYIESTNSTSSRNYTIVMPDHLDMTLTYEWAVWLYRSSYDNSTNNTISRDIESDVIPYGISISDASDIGWRGSAALAINVTYNIGSGTVISYGIKDSTGEIYSISDTSITGLGYSMLYPYVPLNSPDDCLWYVNASAYPESNWSFTAQDALSFGTLPAIPLSITPHSTQQLNVSWYNLPESEYNLSVALNFYNGTDYIWWTGLSWQNESLVITSTNQIGSIVVNVDVGTIDATLTYNWVTWLSLGSPTEEDLIIGRDTSDDVIISGLSIIDAPNSAPIGTAYSQINVSYNLTGVISYGIKDATGSIISINHSNSVSGKGYIVFNPYVPLDATTICYWFANASTYPESNWSFNTKDIELLSISDAPNPIIPFYSYTALDGINLSWVLLPNATYNISVALMYYNGSEYHYWSGLPWNNATIEIGPGGYKNNDSIRMDIHLKNFDVNLKYFWVAWITLGEITNEDLVVARANVSDIVGEGIAFVNASPNATLGCAWKVNLSYNVEANTDVTFGIETLTGTTLWETTNTYSGLGYIEEHIWIPEPEGMWIGGPARYYIEYNNNKSILGVTAYNGSTLNISASDTTLIPGEDLPVKISWDDLSWLKVTYANISVILTTYEGYWDASWGYPWVNITNVDITHAGYAEALLKIPEFFDTHKTYNISATLYIGDYEPSSRTWNLSSDTAGNIPGYGVGIVSYSPIAYRGGASRINISVNGIVGDISYKLDDNPVSEMVTTAVSDLDDATVDGKYKFIYVYIDEPQVGWTNPISSFFSINTTPTNILHLPVTVYNGINISTTDLLIPGETITLDMSWYALNVTERNYIATIDIFLFNGTHYLNTSFDSVFRLVTTESGTTSLNLDIPSLFDTTLDYHIIATLNASDITAWQLASDSIIVQSSGIGIVDCSPIAWRGATAPGINITVSDGLGSVTVTYGIKLSMNDQTIWNDTTTVSNYDKLYPYIPIPTTGWDFEGQSCYWFVNTSTQILTSPVAIYNAPIFDITPLDMAIGRNYDISLHWSKDTIPDDCELNVLLVESSTNYWWTGLPKWRVYPLPADGTWSTNFMLNQIDTFKTYKWIAAINISSDHWLVGSDESDGVNVHALYLAFNKTPGLIWRGSDYEIQINYSISEPNTPITYGIRKFGGGTTINSVTLDDLASNSPNYDINVSYIWVADAYEGWNVDGEIAEWFLIATIGGETIEITTSVIIFNAPIITSAPTTILPGQEINIDVSWKMLANDSFAYWLYDMFYGSGAPYEPPYRIKLQLQDKDGNYWKELRSVEYDIYPPYYPTYEECMEHALDNQNGTHTFTLTIPESLDVALEYRFAAWVLKYYDDDGPIAPSQVGSDACVNVICEGVTIVSTPNIWWRGSSAPINISYNVESETTVTYGYRTESGAEFTEETTVSGTGDDHIVHAYINPPDASWKTTGEKAYLFIRYEINEVTYERVREFTVYNAPRIIDSPNEVWPGKTYDVRIEWQNIASGEYYLYLAISNETGSIFEGSDILRYSITSSHFRWGIKTFSYHVASALNLTQDYKFISWLNTTDHEWNVGSDYESTDAIGISISFGPIYYGGVLQLDVSWDVSKIDLLDEVYFGIADSTLQQMIGGITVKTGNFSENKGYKSFYIGIPDAKNSEWEGDNLGYVYATYETSNYGDRCNLKLTDVYYGIKIISAEYNVIIPYNVGDPREYTIEVTLDNLPANTEFSVSAGFFIKEEDDIHDEGGNQPSQTKENQMTDENGHLTIVFTLTLYKHHANTNYINDPDIDYVWSVCVYDGLYWDHEDTWKISSDYMVTDTHYG